MSASSTPPDNTAPDNAAPIADTAAEGRSRSDKRNLAWVTSTYLGQGLPWSFLHQISTEFLVAIKASRQHVGYTSLFHFAVTLKFLWSPLVDLVGRKRTWMVGLQAVMGFGMLLVAMVSQTATAENLAALWIVLAVFSILHASHDVACDGFYMVALSRSGQALFSGVRIAAFRVAMLLGSGPLVYLAGKTSWRLGFSAAGVIMLALAAFNMLVVPRVDEPHLRREESGDVEERRRDRRREFWLAYKTFLTQPQALLVLAFMFLFKLGDIMTFAMSKPLLAEIGIDTANRGILNTIGTLSTVGGSLLGGALLSRYGLRRCLVPMTFLQNAVPLYLLLAIFRPGFWGVVPVVLLEQLFAGLGGTAITVFLMQRSKMAFSASHYAFATAIVSLAATISGTLSGHLSVSVGHEVYFFLAFVMGIPSLVMAIFVPKTGVDDAAGGQAPGSSPASADE